MDKIKISKVKKVQILAAGIPTGDQVRGTLHLTSHHLIFVPSQGQRKVAEGPASKETWITYHIISFCTFRPTPAGSGLVSSIRLRCRDFTFYTFNFDDVQEARDVFESIKGLTCKLGAIEKLYAFTYSGTPQEQAIKGWELYDAKAEWRRQGISEKGVDRGWRISKINSDYVFSPTYPAVLAVPTSISDNVLNYAGRYRSKVRIPVLTYLHPVNNCSITRSAQPKAGLRSHRSVQDEKLVSACFSASGPTDDADVPTPPRSTKSPSASQASLEVVNTDGELTDSELLEDEMIAAVPAGASPNPVVYGSQQHNLIVDARPTVNALAMQAVGLGSENMDNYKFAAKVYLGIENIHVMRDSLAKVIEAIKDSDLTTLPPNKDLLEKSGWKKHITGLLAGSALIARQVGIHHSHVLIHCSDGWDRTSQLSALAQLLLDPYYRTLDGFIVLVEKDWVSFGHMFQHRNGYLNSEKWFVTQNDGLAGTAVQPGGSNDGRGDPIENALANAKRFFTKKTQMSDEVDSDGEPIHIDDVVKAKQNAKDTLAGQEATKPKETSPVFHQFLDCVYQLLRDHPTRFEFNERFLKRLLYHLYSCQYGTFLYNNEKSRLDAHVQERTRSVWDYFLARREAWLNPNYDSVIDDHERGRERLIFPNLDNVKWWHEVFGRTDADMNGPTNAQTERYLGVSGAKEIGTGIITGIESAHAALGAGTTKHAPPAGNNGGFATLKESFSNLGIGIGKGSPGTRSPSGVPNKAMEVEMQ